MHRPRSRFGRAPLVAAAALGLIVLFLGAAGAAVASPVSAASAPARPTPAAVTALGFAARAGYADWQVADSTGARPTSAPQTVDVVFQAQNGSRGLPSAAAAEPVAQFARGHGLSPAAYAAAIQYFRDAGVQVVHTWPDRLTLSLAGSPAALDRAFGTQLLAGSYQGRPVVYPATAPSLPSSIEEEVAGVVGLSSGFSPFSFSLSPTPAGGHVAASGSVTPGNARALYNLSQLYNLTGGAQFATSESIALILWGAGFAPGDISTFFSQDYPSSFPAPKVLAYPIDGASAPSSSALDSKQPLDVEELTLDLEWSGSMAPGATLDAIYPPGPSESNLTDALEKALSLPNVTAISMSFGAPESSEGSLISAWDPLFSEAADRGITVLAATGDSGGDTNSSCTGGPAPDYPATSPQVLAVGGTAVTVDRSPLGSITGYAQSAWSGSGGGFSARYGAPGWQQVGSAGTQIAAAGGGRGIPDVSATALDNFLYYDGQNQMADGTSFATPLWAGLVTEMDAHIGHALGFFTDRLYHLTANQSATPANDGIADITSGKNCVSEAIPGWDAATGWGTPRAAALYEELDGSFVRLSLTADPTTVAPGGAVTVSVQVANWTTGVPIASAPVVVRLAGVDSVGPCTGTFDAAGATSNGSGGLSVQLSVPACYLGSHASASASVATDKLYGRVSTRVAVNLLGFVPSLESLGDPPYSYLLYVGIVGSAIAAGGWLGRRPPGPVVVPRGAVSPPPPPATSPRTPARPPGSGAPIARAPTPAPSSPGGSAVPGRSVSP